MNRILASLIAATIIGTAILPMSCTANASWSNGHSRGFGYSGSGYRGFGYRGFGYRGFGYGFATGVAVGAALAAPYPYCSYAYNPYVGYYPPGGSYHVGYYPPGYPDGHVPEGGC